MAAMAAAQVLDKGAWTARSQVPRVRMPPMASPPVAAVAALTSQPATARQEVRVGRLRHLAPQTALPVRPAVRARSFPQVGISQPALAAGLALLAHLAWPVASGAVAAAAVVSASVPRRTLSSPVADQWQGAKAGSRG